MWSFCEIMKHFCSSHSDSITFQMFNYFTTMIPNTMYRSYDFASPNWKIFVSWLFVFYTSFHFSCFHHSFGSNWFWFFGLSLHLRIFVRRMSSDRHEKLLPFVPFTVISVSSVISLVIKICSTDFAHSLNFHCLRSSIRNQQ